MKEKSRRRLLIEAWLAVPLGLIMVAAYIHGAMRAPTIIGLAIWALGAVIFSAVALLALSVAINMTRDYRRRRRRKNRDGS